MHNIAPIQPYTLANAPYVPYTEVPPLHEPIPDSILADLYADDWTHRIMSRLYSRSELVTLWRKLRAYDEHKAREFEYDLLADAGRRSKMDKGGKSPQPATGGYALWRVGSADPVQGFSNAAEVNLQTLEDDLSSYFVTKIVRLNERDPRSALRSKASVINKTPAPKFFGDRVKYQGTPLAEYRRLLGWTQQDAANHFGVSERAIRSYESGARKLPSRIAEQVAHG